MKKIMKTIGCLFLSMALIVTVALTAFADSGKTMKVTLRIEGIKANLFYKTEEVPYTDSLTLRAALQYIDAKEDSLKITGMDANFISDINGDTSAKFGGWDGWLYKVNGQEAAVGIDDYALKDGDSILLYYGDPYGVGMQFPVSDTSELSKGILKFTSSDTTFGADGSSTVKVNPVAGAAVTWNYGGGSAQYTTDANGEIKIDPAQLTVGTHAIQIAKANSTGLPLVLRFAPDYAVTVTANEAQSTTSTTASSTASATVTTVEQAQTTAVSASTVSSAIQTEESGVQTEPVSPKTGCDCGTVEYAVILSVVAAGIMIMAVKGRQLFHEK